MPQVTLTQSTNQINAITKAGRSDINKMATTAVMPGTENVPEGELGVPAPTTPANDDPGSSKFLELAKREKRFRDLQVKLQKDQERIDQERARLDTRSKEYETNYVPKERLKSDLLGVLSEMGFDPAAVQTAFQTGTPVSHELIIKQLQKEIADLRAGTETVTKTLEQNKASQFESAVQNVRNQAKSLVAKDPNFETIKEMGKEEDIVQHILKVFNEGEQDAEGNEVYPVGTVLDVTDVAAKIEEKLVAEAMRMASLNKVKQKLAPPPAPAEVGTKQKIQINPKQAQIKTLTNTMTATSTKPLSAAERRARAIAIAQGRTPE